MKRAFPVPARFDAQRRCLMAGGRALTGLNPALQTAFYPHYRFDAATQGPLHPSPAQPWPAGFPQSPQARGRVLDRVVQRVCQTDGETRQRIRPQWLTGRVLGWLAQHGLRPVSSQLVVADHGARVGTPLDLVCRDAEGAPVVLELKTGYETYLDRHTGTPMNPPFYTLPDSPRWQHQLYVAFAISMYERQEQETVNRELSGVLYFGRDTTCHVPVAPWSTTRRLMAAGWAQLARKKTWDRRKRRKVVRAAQRARGQQGP